MGSVTRGVPSAPPVGLDPSVGAIIIGYYPSPYPPSSIASILPPISSPPSLNPSPYHKPNTNSSSAWIIPLIPPLTFGSTTLSALTLPSNPASDISLASSLESALSSDIIPTTNPILSILSSLTQQIEQTATPTPTPTPALPLSSAPAPTAPDEHFHTTLPGGNTNTAVFDGRHPHGSRAALRSFFACLQLKRQEQEPGDKRENQREQE
ncbi:MAG: hypothetical protein LQ340_003640 [Diploschistes diacapsis]|nr:MAG: hypothetical protein LQ340_003640 [Diploschistes diacapsis]